MVTSPISPGGRAIRDWWMYMLEKISKQSFVIRFSMQLKLTSLAELKSGIPK
jgi:hypothetical protein